MFDPLVQLLARQVHAAQLLEARLRALELIVVAGEQRFLVSALDEVEDASEALASLELTRNLVLSVAGCSPDITAEELLAHPGVGEATAAALRATLDELRAVMLRLADARSRTDHEIRAAAAATRQRRDVVAAFAAV